MKKILYAFVFVCSGLMVNAQTTFLAEHFDYPAGDSLQNHGWYAHSAGTTSPILVHTSGLSWSQTPYIGSGVGNAAIVNNNGSDENLPLVGGNPTDGNVYISFLLKLDGPVASANRGYFLHTGEYSNIDTPDFNSISFAFRARTFVTIGSTPDKFRLGLTFNSGSTPSNVGVDVTNDLDTGVTYLVVLKYSFIDGPDNDEIFMYVFEDGDDISVEPATATLGPIVGTQPDMSVMQYVAFRQYNRNPNLVVDGLIVKDAWDLLPIQIDDFNLLTPADGARVLITDVMTEEVNITWESTTAGGEPVAYTFKTDTVGGGTFGNPFIDVPSNNGGADNQLTFTFGQVNTSFGVPEGDSISFIWTVFASAGGITKEANMPFELKLVREKKVSINKINSNVLKVYPNPTSNFVNIELPSNLTVEAKVSLTNVLGQEVILNDVIQNTNGMQLNVAHLPNGVYTIKVVDSGLVSTGSIVIQK